MAEIERYSPDDRRGLEQLYRRTYGHEAVDRLRFLWDWARRNPAADAAPPFWVVREGPTVIAACPVTPVRVLVLGSEVSGAWSAGPLVVAERQRFRILHAFSARSNPGFPPFSGGQGASEKEMGRKAEG